MADAAERTFCVPVAHPVFDGHFPGQPIVPGVMLMEWVLRVVADTRGCATATLRIREAKFFTPLEPGKSAQLEFEVQDTRCTFRIRHAQTLLARGILEWDSR